MTSRGLVLLGLSLGCGAACGARSPVDGVGAGSDAAPHPQPTPACDRDGDGWRSCGGDDCNDDDPAIHPGAPDDTRWVVEMVDETVGVHHTMTVGDDGTAHFAYSKLDGDSDLRYATNAGGAWSYEDLPTGKHVITSFPSIATRGGEVWVTHFQFDSPGDEIDDLVLRTRAGGAWTSEAIESDFGLLVDSSIAVGPDGHLQCVYTDGARVAWAVRDASGWTIETITTSGPLDVMSPSLAIGDDGVAHAAFYDGEAPNGARYARRDAKGVWSLGGFKPAFSSTFWPSLATSPGGAVHAAFQGESTDGRRAVWHATSIDGARWALEMVAVVDLPPTEVSIATDRVGAHVVWADGEGTIYYSTSSSGSWIVTTLARASKSPIVAVHANGTVHVSWIDGEHALVHAHRAPPDGIDQDCDGIVDG